MALDILSPSEQVAQHLQELILQRHWGNDLPGTPTLSKETGVDRKTITAAIQLLEKKGLLQSQGSGRPRRISIPDDLKAPGLRVAFLLYEERDRNELYTHKLLQKLREAGHTPTLSKKTLTELGMDVKKVADYVQSHPADVWIPASASREILEWFAAQTFPSIALFGRRRDVPIAGVGPEKIEALQQMTKRLVELGHQRIVLLSREERRHPTLGMQEQKFLETLKAHGIPAGSYNLPEWKNDAAGFSNCLEQLFQVTPPTALIVDESQFFLAALVKLSSKGISVPREVSMFCTDDDLVFKMSEPKISCISWPSDPVVNRIAKWIQEVSRGKISRTQMYTPAKIIEGGTIGPAIRTRLVP